MALSPLTALFLAAGLTLASSCPLLAADRSPRSHDDDELPDTAIVAAPEPLTILGPTEVSADRMWAFVSAVNPDFSPTIARAFYEVGQRYGIRGDVALCQAIVETGWFRFEGGTAVTPDQHNYCGLGVTRLGLKGHSFATVEEGVTAHIQHLYAYASRSPLPRGEKVIDPRFTMVRRGVAPAWTDLNRRWAANDRYGESILAVFERLMRDDPPAPAARAAADGSPKQVLEIGIPDDMVSEAEESAERE